MVLEWPQFNNMDCNVIVSRQRFGYQVQLISVSLILEAMKWTEIF